MLVTVDGIVMLVMAVLPLNALSPILVKLVGNVTCVANVQLQKAFVPKLVIPLGITTGSEVPLGQK